MGRRCRRKRRSPLSITPWLTIKARHFWLRCRKTKQPSRKFWPPTWPNGVHPPLATSNWHGVEVHWSKAKAINRERPPTAKRGKHPCSADAYKRTHNVCNNFMDAHGCCRQTACNETKHSSLYASWTQDSSWRWFDWVSRLQKQKHPLQRAIQKWAANTGNDQTSQREDENCQKEVDTNRDAIEAYESMDTSIKPAKERSQTNKEAFDQIAAYLQDSGVLEWENGLDSHLKNGKSALWWTCTHSRPAQRHRRFAAHAADRRPKVLTTCGLIRSMVDRDG